MQVAHQVVVVTGGAHGIGAALCRRFAAEQPRGLVVADVDEAGACQVAAETGGLAVACDVASLQSVQSLVDRTTREFGRIDLFCSNAGVETGGGIDAPLEAWQRIWEINVLAHVHAARAVIPGMLERGGGYLLQTASAAGLLTQLSSAPYSVTKHAAVAFAEWLSITYGERGIGVSCLCPLGVRTNMLMSTDDPVAVMLRQNLLEPEQVAEAVIGGLAEERFLILPHPEVAEFFRRKGQDYDRWLRGMRRLRASLPGM